MNQNSEECIKMLVELEPVFKKAGELALKMRATAKSKSKYHTGMAGIDIVTEADTAVQEFIISEMAKTKLVECQLIAEEDTPSVSEFKGTNGLVLALDPIDGTLIYASTGRFFSVIVSLNDKKDILYTFCHYPLINWTRKIANGEVKDFGNFPEIDVKKDNLDKTIFYTSKGPKKINSDVYKKIIEQGYNFRKVSEVTSESGSCTLFFSGKVGGYYMETPNPYDGTVALHYGKTKKLQVFSELDISTFETGDHGPHYPGWYLVLQK